MKCAAWNCDVLSSDSSQFASKRGAIGRAIDSKINVLQWMDKVTDANEAVLVGQKVLHDIRRMQHGSVRWPLILLLAIVSAVYLFQYWRGEISTAQVEETYKTSIATNALALGVGGPPGWVAIAIHQPVDLNFKSREEILRLRTAVVMENPQLLTRPYVPTPEVFGQVVDGAPWWGIEGQFYHGPGSHSIEGPSEEARFLLNPYLLVAAEFNDYWHDTIAATEVAHFQFYCAPRDLRWHPQEAYAETTYAADCIAKRQTQQFDLIAFNARDLGLKYIYVSYADSKNVTKQQPPSTAYANPQFIHKGGSCGYPGGCNNMSPLTPPIDGIQLTGLPAVIVVWLWKEQPGSVSRAPDMRFVVHFR